MSRRFVVEVTERYIVTLEDSFNLTYEANDGTRQSRGTAESVAIDLATRHDRPLSMTDGYADLPDDAADVRLEDTDFDVREL
jgi:hypothetical protein